MTADEFASHCKTAGWDPKADLTTHVDAESKRSYRRKVRLDIRSLPPNIDGSISWTEYIECCTVQDPGDASDTLVWVMAPAEFLHFEREVKNRLRETTQPLQCDPPSVPWVYLPSADKARVKGIEATVIGRRILITHAGLMDIRV